MHKTFGGMVRAIERLIAELKASPPDDDREDRAYRDRADALIKECDVAWTNDAQGLEAARLKNRLLDALDGCEVVQECAYCGHDIPVSELAVPRGGDDDEWAALARMHAPDCEWVATRAHRRELA